MLNPFKNIGPGTIVAAAFIGPGTVTVCTLAGVRHGYELLWAVLISMVATIVLQEMSARLGLVTQRGLMENLNRTLTHKWVRYSAVFLVLIAILLGNTAYEAGNIMGGTMGIQNMVGSDTNQQETVLYSLVIGVLAFALLYFGKYKAVEKTLIILVVTMSLTFVVTALLTRPDAGEVLRGLLIPTIPGNGLEVIAIIGTTVVPYNIFLHASIVGEKWKGPEDLKKMRADTYLAIALGGIISMAIIVSATSVNGEIQSPTDLAMALEPLLGEWARYFIGMGLFAAGVSSAITAPMAAAYVARGLEIKGDPQKRFQRTWMGVLSIGVVIACLGFRPIEIIKIAQVANGLLLPVIAFFLIWICSQERVLGRYKNTRWQIVVASAILMTTILLGLNSILKALEVL